MREIEVFHDSGLIDVSVIESFETKIGYIFPENYKYLLSKHNELYPEMDFFKFFNEIDNKNDCRDVSFLGYGSQVTEASRIERAQDHDVYGRDGIVVIGRCANGDYICFDYRDNLITNNPPVAVMFHDFFDGDDKMFICPVANNFEQFIDLLYKNDED
jgi:hypothetical protein